MYFEKRYLQFNDLVFDSYDMLSDYNEPANMKSNTVPYSYGHGSYMPLKTDYVFVQERSVSMTITLHLLKLPCEQRRFYVQFALQELMKPGKLWAIKNGEIIWANASVKNVNQVITRKQNEAVFDVEFVIPDGVWNKADMQKTFLLPYSVCSFMDCKGFADITGCGCCDGCADDKAEMLRMNDCGCCCDTDVTAEMALCNHLNDLQKFYSCETPYQLKYDCVQAENFSDQMAFGQRICKKNCDEPVISGQLYSRTDIPTNDVTLTLTGWMKSPAIKINDNTNIIEGEYKGELIIKSNGDVYYKTTDCCDGELLDPSVWVVPKGNFYGWEIKPQWNSVTVNMNACCERDIAACVYIDHVAITI